MRDASNGRRLVIVGGGASGVAAFVAAVRYGAAQSIDIVDPAGIGLGTAFAAKHPALLCNTSVETMSILDDDHGDFLAYLRSIGMRATADAFVPRMYVSRYLRARYEQFAAGARAAGIAHACVKAAVLRIEKAARGHYRLWLDDGTTLEATDVLVCIGHGAPHVPEAIRPHIGAAGLFESLYPEDCVLDALAPRSRVLVLGSRLSAVDAALLLCGAGHSVQMASPSGRLPAVRTATPRASPVAVDDQALMRLDLDSPMLSWRLLRAVARTARAVRSRPLREQVVRTRDPIERMRQEAELARQGVTDWQAVLVRYMDAGQVRLRGEAPDAQRRALAECSRIVGRYLFACPLQSAEKLLDYARDRRLSVRAATPAQLERTSQWIVRWQDGSQDAFDALVCATGFRRPPQAAGVDVLLFGEATGEAAATGAALDVGPDLRVRLDRAAPAERIWTVGLASQPGEPIVNAVYQSVRQAYDVFRSWHAADATRQFRRSVAEEAG